MIAAVLAKKSERFPGKHMQKLNGTTLIGEVVKRIRASSEFESVVILTKDPDVTDMDAIVLKDFTEGTALDSIAFLIERYGAVFVFGGDMPFICPEFIRKMIRQYTGIPMFPIHRDGSIEPVHGIYNRDMIDSISEYTSKGRKSLKGLIELCRHDTVAIEEKEEDCFININYRDDMDRAEKNRGNNDD